MIILLLAFQSQLEILKKQKEEITLNLAGVYSSGKFTTMNNRITKRGSKRLRKAIHLAVQCSL
ncbi:IS110 family transposase [Paenibacillus polymyxa]|nr:IS110 family transposase [Paenibacillus polymyxa]